MSSNSPNHETKPFVGQPSSSSRTAPESRTAPVSRSSGKQRRSPKSTRSTFNDPFSDPSVLSYKNQSNIPIRSYGTTDFQHHFYTNTNNFIVHPKQNHVMNMSSSSPPKLRMFSKKRNNSFSDKFSHYSTYNSNNEDPRLNSNTPSSPIFKDIHRSSTLLDGLHFHPNLSDADNLLDSFEDSHPSSSDDDDDDGSSLDDVCLPIVTQSTSKKTWPDLQMLQDFYNEEIEESLAYRNSLEQQHYNQADIAGILTLHKNFASQNEDSILQDTSSLTSCFSNAYQNHNNNTKLTSSNNKSNQPVVGFRTNLVSKVDGATPVSISNNKSNLSLPNFATKKINETEQIKGRLRPPVFSPWDNKSIKQNLLKYLTNDLKIKQQQQNKSKIVSPRPSVTSSGIPHVSSTNLDYTPNEQGDDMESETHPLLSSPPLEQLHHQLHNNDIMHNHNKIPHESLSYQQQLSGVKRFEQFRYTYFRPNLDSTIHSSSISGLLQDGQTFADLFVKERYMTQEVKAPASIIKSFSPSNSTPAAGTTAVVNQPPSVTTSTVSETLSSPNNQKASNGEMDPPVKNNKINSNLVSTHGQLPAGSVQPESTSFSGTTAGGVDPSAPQANNQSAAAATTVSNTPSVSEDVIPFWLDILDPTEEEMKVLSKAFGIHPLTTEDIFLNEAREKVELFKDYYFVCFRSFDIVHERLKRKALNEKLAILERLNLEELKSHGTFDENNHYHRDSMLTNIKKTLFGKLFSNNNNTGSDPDNYFDGHLNKYSTSYATDMQESMPYGDIQNDINERSEIMKDSKLRNQAIAKVKKKIRKQKSRDRDLEPLNFYIIVFHSGVLTFHFSPTPHPVTVRRRARLLKDYLTVSSDWIAYALIDDITDAFGPMIETIEEEVYSFEDAILKLHSKDDDSEDESSDNDESEDDFGNDLEAGGKHSDRKSVFSTNTDASGKTNSSRHSRSTFPSSISTSSSVSSLFSSTTSNSSSSSRASGRWAKKGHMLRKIGESRKRIMSLLRLLGSKADVIKGLSKRCNENFDVTSRSEIGMYLGDIQDHILTMVQSLNHYEKLLARSHTNYLAQINIDMTKVNNDMNDVLGKITVLGTLVLPMNIITGLWGMNVIVPGQNDEGLQWFFGILISMLLLCIVSYYFTVKFYNF